MTARALVLDPTHRVLLVRRPGGSGWGLLSEHVGATERPLVAIERAIRERLGVNLQHHPCGARPLSAEPFDFVYLTTPSTDPDPEIQWVPIRAVGDHAPEDADTIWSLYTDVMLGGFEPPGREIDVFSFGSSPEMAARLAHLVVKGTKRATAGWVDAELASDATIPSPGLVSVVTDGFGIPLCCIQSERVEHQRFGDITDEIAEAEGEGDRGMDFWREAHRRAFTQEGDALGLVFDDDAVVFLEFFRVLKVFSRSD